MSNTVRGDGAEQSETNQSHPDPTKVPVARTPEAVADRLAREFAQEFRVRIPRSKAAVARSDVDALAALHLDPETLEGLLDTATPQEAERLRTSEHEISVCVDHARAKAEAAEAAYEQAVLDDFDEAER